jgi:hypothetical protein
LRRKRGGYLKTGQYVEAAAVASGKYVTNNKFLNTIGAAVGVKNAGGRAARRFRRPELGKGLIPQMLV